MYGVVVWSAESPLGCWLGFGRRCGGEHEYLLFAMGKWCVCGHRLDAITKVGFAGGRSVMRVSYLQDCDVGGGGSEMNGGRSEISGGRCETKGGRCEMSGGGCEMGGGSLEGGQ